jgi:ribonucleoside-diphosphate reductase beta chain
MMCGDWNQMWGSFDKRQLAKGAVAAANEDTAGEGEDMFARAGVAAE